MDTPKNPEASEPRTSSLVLIGTSIQGLDSLATLLESLPPDFPASIVVALGLESRQPQRLAEALADRSAPCRSSS